MEGSVMVRKITEMPKVTGVSNIYGPGVYRYGETQMIPYVRQDIISDLIDQIDAAITANNIRDIEAAIYQFEADLAEEGVTR